MSLLNWFLKNQSTIEQSMFGTEFVAMKLRVNTLCVIQYKLSMVGVPISRPNYIYEDNMLVFHNTSQTESMLEKRCNATA